MFILLHLRYGQEERGTSPGGATNGDETNHPALPAPSVHKKVLGSHSRLALIDEGRDMRCHGACFCELHVFVCGLESFTGMGIAELFDFDSRGQRRE